MNTELNFAHFLGETVEGAIKLVDRCAAFRETGGPDGAEFSAHALNVMKDSTVPIFQRIDRVLDMIVRFESGLHRVERPDATILKFEPPGAVATLGVPLPGARDENTAAPGAAAFIE